MKRWTKAFLMLGCSAAAFTSLTLAQVDEAEACSPPPPSDCAVSLDCALLAPHGGITDEMTAPSADFIANLFVDASGASDDQPICGQLLTTMEEALVLDDEGMPVEDPDYDGDPPFEPVVGFGFLGSAPVPNALDPFNPMTWEGWKTTEQSTAASLEAEYDLDGACGDLSGDSELVHEANISATADVELGGRNQSSLEMEFNPGPERTCEIGGDVTVKVVPPWTMTGYFEWWLGQPYIDVSVDCHPQDICLSSPSPEVEGEAAIDVELLASDGVVNAKGGQAVVFEYQVTSNVDQTFVGNVELVSANTAAPTRITEPVASLDEQLEEFCTEDVDEPDDDDKEDCSDVETQEVCGCDLKTYSNSCELDNAGVQKLSDGECVDLGSAPGVTSVTMTEGDTFPADFYDNLDDVEQCIPLPDNPNAFGDVVIEREITLGAGETKIIKIVQRSFDGCTQGSCSNNAIKVTGAVGDEPLVACGSGALRVSADGGSLEIDEDTEIEYIECESGDVSTPEPYEDGDDRWEIIVPEDSNGSGIPDFIEDVIDYLPDPDANPDDYTREALLDRDSNGNGVSDYVEIVYGYDPYDDSTPANPEDYSIEELLKMDSNGNGVSDYEEIFIYGSDPFNADDPIFVWPYITIDTNGNGVPDFIEVAFGYDPLDDSSPSNADDYTWDALLEQDSTGNGIMDIVEILFGYDPMDPDSEPDNPEDYTKEALKDRDSDSDGLTDYEEIWEEQTHPLDPDTDNDGYLDGEEVDNGTDPLDPTDPDDMTGTAEAGLIFKGSSPELSTLVYGYGSTLAGSLDVLHAQAKASAHNIQDGRIAERVTVDTSSSSAGDIIELEIPFDVMLEDSQSPYEVNRLELGQIDNGADDYISAKGKIRLDSSPYTVFDVMYRASVWATNPANYQQTKLVLDDADFVMEEDRFTVSLNFEMPDYDFERLDIYHDMNANERLAYQETCDDGVDNTGNGLVDCDDPYCADDPACTGEEEPGDDTGPSEPGDDVGDEVGDDVGVPGNADDGPNAGANDSTGPGANDSQGDDDDDSGSETGQDGGDTDIESGCGCAATGSGSPVGFVVMLLLGFALMARRTRDVVTDA